MHCASIVYRDKQSSASFSTMSGADERLHLDLTTSNILSRLSPHVIKWSDAEAYAHLGDPETQGVRTHDGQQPGPHAPAMLVALIENSGMSDAMLPQESIVVSDSGQP